MENGKACCKSCKSFTCFEHNGTLKVNGTLKLMETQSANTKELEKAITFEKIEKIKLMEN